MKLPEQKHVKIAIIGAGPAGTTLSMGLSKHGIDHVLLDKSESFPRDKICGDAISGKSMIYLKELDLFDKIEKEPSVVITKVTISSPKGDQIDLDLDPKGTKLNKKGYVCRREVFDNILFQEAKAISDYRENFTVKDLLIKEDQVYGISGINSENQREEFTAKVVIGADGFSSIIARKMNIFQREEKHWAVATRAYYTGIKGLRDSLELHYHKDFQSGYFWIFPLENGMANVGIGMLDSVLKSKKINIKEAHEKAIQSDFFRERFKDAELIHSIQGANLPFGSLKRTIYGNGFVLIGDAAGLVDPFTGEGIGNAMLSAKTAVDVLKDVCQGDRFTEKELKIYQDKVRKSLDSELKFSHRLQLLGKHFPFVVNLIVSRAKKNPKINDLISNIVANTADVRTLLNPVTYFKLFGRKS